MADKATQLPASGAAGRAAAAMKGGFPADGPLASAGPDMQVTFDAPGLAALRADYVQRFSALWAAFQRGEAPAISDRRFASAAWRDTPGQAWNAAWYLTNAEFLQRMSDLVCTDERTRGRIQFALRQLIDAASPANYLASNPQAQQEALQSGGRSLGLGLGNLLADLAKGRISHSDLSAFEVGRNLAATPGSVVYRNQVFELIQYAPCTPTVAVRPLLIVPPCINKYYVLDLQPHNSLVADALARGNTVFLVSWKNIDRQGAHLGWDDYLRDGVIRAIDTALQISGQTTLNAMGFCIGGTLLSTALAVLAAQGRNPAASLTLLATLLDFEDPGPGRLFIDEAQVAAREASIGAGGLMEGREMDAYFSFLRPDELVWNYVVDNYLRGTSPPAFDVLFWNADNTNLSGPMFCWYMRHLYLQNGLARPGALSTLGQPIDLRRIEAPAYVLGCRRDHIVPWTSAWKSSRALGGEQRFVLASGGHIAGVVSPPGQPRRGHRVQSAAPAHGASPGSDRPMEDAAAWLQVSIEQPGSWWDDWGMWLAQHRGGTQPAPAATGSALHPPLEPAPGRYVLERL